MTEASLLDQLILRISSINPMQRRPLSEARSSLADEEVFELESYLEFCGNQGYGIDALAGAYQTITLDTLREQVYFQRTGHYRYSTFEEVARKVYLDRQYMTAYMYGLALTLFLWPNHLDILRFFRRVLPRRPGGAYLEIGPGHGVFFRHATLHGEFGTCIGVDLSPTSLQMTERLLSSDPAIGPNLWKLVQTDFLTAPGLPKGFDVIVMGEVLEHVEKPLDFLRRIRELSREGAFIFVTTAVNAPAIDHIYLFRTVDEVLDLATMAGLRVKEVFAAPYKGCSMDASMLQRLPINVALVLEA